MQNPRSQSNLLRGGHHMPMHPSAGAGGGIAPQHHQSSLPPTAQHNHKIPNTTTSASDLIPSTLQTVDRMREQHSRLDHHQQQTQQHHPQSMQQSSSQMQKIRQQHQHVNVNNVSNSSNANNTIKTNHLHSQYNYANAQQHQHMSATQQQRNIPQQQRLPQHQQFKNHRQSSPSRNINRKQQHLLVLPNATPQACQPQQQQNKRNFNKTYNPSTETYSSPKSILQNPNRLLNNTPHLQAAVGTILNQEAVNVVSGAATTAGVEIAAVPVAIANVAAVASKTIAPAAAAASEEIAPTSALTEAPKVADIVEVEMTEGNESSKECGDELPKSINTILPNEDSSVPKNSKEKTPMCLVNELARFNKISHQYRLTSEHGPAHCKRFTVTLKLGDEEYSAEGYKIKKAQHLAAGAAIEKTKYKHPMPKPNRRTDGSDGGPYRANITPTVELNALAMKLGQPTYYLFDPRTIPPPDMGPPTGDGPMPPLPPYGPASHHLPPHLRMLDPMAASAYMRRNAFPQKMMPHHGYGPQHGHVGGGGFPPGFHPRGGFPMIPPNHYPHFGPHGLPPPPVKITLIVGKQKFVGIGRTLQQAKHDAAARALQVLKVQAPAQQHNDTLNNSTEEGVGESDSKSPISLVHEIGIKRNLTVHFKVLREDGPAHMKNFVTACIVGTIATEGDGNGKKISKKRAAEKMLEELKKLPPLTPIKSPVKHIKMKTPGGGGVTSDVNPHDINDMVPAAGGTVMDRRDRRKRLGSSVKDRTTPDIAEEEGVDAEHPITKLIQLAQSRKEKEPVFELIAKNGNEQSRRRHYIIEVATQGMVARGSGPSKKLAKRNAAKNLLIAIGIEPESDAAVTPTAAKSKSQTESLPKILNNSCSAVVLTETNKNPTPPATDANTSASSAAVAPADDANTSTTALATKMPTDIGDILPLISTSAGQVPGILILRQNKKHASKKREIAAANTTTPVQESATEKKEQPAKTMLTLNNPTTLPAATSIAPAVNAAAASIASVVSTAAEPLQSTEPSTVNAPLNTAGISSCTKSAAIGVTAQASASASETASSANNKNGDMKRELLYLAKVLGFEVSFSDYPKGNHNEFLSIVRISTNPPQICHGLGSSTEESQNDAASNGLKILSQLGFGEN